MTRPSINIPYDPDGVVKIFQGFVWVKFLYFNTQMIKSGALLTCFQQALDSAKITDADLKTKKIVLDCLCEGQGREQIAAAIDCLKTTTWFDPDRLIFLSNVNDDLSDIVKTVSWPWYMTNHSGWLDHFRSQHIDFDSLPRDRFFTCLIRRRSDLRGQLIRRLLSKYQTHQCVLSYASMVEYTVFDPIAGIQIPLLLDGPTPGNQQHMLTDTRAYQSLINIIAETSNQETGSWTTRFITEKTFKCFAWQQIPIWWTVPGVVNDVRSLGFDVFDDVMDGHKYDSIQDPIKRLDQIMETLDRAITKCYNNDFYTGVRSRFKNNWQHLLNMENRRLGHWPEIINRVRTI